MSNNEISQLYSEDIVATYSALSEYFFEYLDRRYGDEYEYISREHDPMLLDAMAELGHKALNMAKLNESLYYHADNGDLDANPNAVLDCPNFDKYFLD